MKGSVCGIKLMMALSKKKERCDGGGGRCFALLNVTVIGLYDSPMFTGKRLKPLLHIVSQMFSFGSALILLLPLTS